MNGRNRLRWFLVGSLALNLFLGGLFAGQWLADSRAGPDRGRPPMRLHLGPAMQHLPPELREEAREVMERYRPATRAAFDEARRARAGILAALKAEPFEPAAFAAALAAHREAAGAAHAEMHKAMAEVAAKLPPEARRAMAENMARRGDKRRRPPPPKPD